MAVSKKQLRAILDDIDHTRTTKEREMVKRRMGKQDTHNPNPRRSSNGA